MSGATGPAAATAATAVSVVLFTGDLRLHDHPPLRAALAARPDAAARDCAPAAAQNE
ncbi:hypothetical protein AB0A69_32820 [Streptomyces sp. NPDC045431]|uniref:hypothetical protein n=1 Tax=Streptomyces sp. NPDC045431 TaxID=3155613 RepID=UPI0033F3F718